MKNVNKPGTFFADKQCLEKNDTEDAGV